MIGFPVSFVMPAGDESPTPKRPDYDMFDSTEDLVRYRPIAGALETLDGILGTTYDVADKGAIRHQKHHRALTLLAAVFGTAAVLFAIAHLSGIFPAPWPMWVEVLAATVATCAVLLGVVQAQHMQWLLQRHKAERCRLLKFRFLIDPGLWSAKESQRADWSNRLRREAEKVEGLNSGSFRDWVKGTETPAIPDEIKDCRLGGNALAALAAYFRDKRIEDQMRFFAARAHRNEGIDRFTRRLPPVLFFGSVVAVLGHFVMEIIRAGKAMHTLSVLLVVAAAALPVIGAGIRTYRSAHEFARSASLYRAKHAALQHLAERLQGETEGPEVLRTLWHCEIFLESEHREWLRLMLDAEWFG
jgi:hypothetical protein